MTCMDHNATREKFDKYYVSASLDDRYFDLIIINAWKLSGPHVKREVKVILQRSRA